MAEGDTWESKKKLKNVADLVQEFKEEYERDNQEVSQQKKSRGG